MIICHYGGVAKGIDENVAEAVGYRLAKMGVDVCYEGNSSIDENVKEVREADCYTMNVTFIKEQYVVLFLSEKMFTDIDALIELDVLKKLYDKSQIKVFTVLYGDLEGRLPMREKWLCKTKVFNINDVADIRNIAASIALEFWKDKLKDVKNRDLKSFFDKNSGFKGSFAEILLRMSSDIEMNDFSLRVLILVVLAVYLDKQKRLSKNQAFVSNLNCITSMYSQISAGIPATRVDFEVLNCCIIDLLNKVRLYNIELIF